MNLDDLIIGNKPDFSKPVLFLDFDGVINIYSEVDAADKRTLLETTVTVPANDTIFNETDREITFCYFKEVVDFLKDKNCIWISSWKKATQTVLNPLFGFDFGYIDWNYLGFSDMNDGGIYGKVYALKEIVQQTNCDWLFLDDTAFLDMEIYTYGGIKEGHIINPWPNSCLSEQNCVDIANILQKSESKSNNENEKRMQAENQLNQELKTDKKFVKKI